MNGMQPTAPKKENEKIKERMQRDGAEVTGNVSDRNDRAGKPGVIDPGEFERRMVKAFEKVGMGYEDLVDVPSENFEKIYNEHASGQITFGEAARRLRHARGR